MMSQCRSMEAQLRQNEGKVEAMMSQLSENRELVARLQKEHTRLEVEHARLVTENRQLREETRNTAAALRAAEDLLKENERETKRLAAELGRTAKQLLDKESKEKETEGIIAELREKNTVLLREKDKLSDAFSSREKQLEAATYELQKATDSMQSAYDLIQRLKDQHPQVYETIVKAKPALPDRPIQGKVVAVDKKLGLVIINVGQLHGVKAGHSFIVFRGSNYVGKVIVDEVFPGTSAARYEHGSMKGDVEVGDDAATKLRVDF